MCCKRKRWALQSQNVIDHDHGLEDQNDQGHLNQENLQARVKVSPLHLPGEMELFLNMSQEADKGDGSEVLGKMRFFLFRQTVVLFSLLCSFFFVRGVVVLFIGLII